MGPGITGGVYNLDKTRGIYSGAFPGMPGSIKSILIYRGSPVPGFLQSN